MKDHLTERDISEFVAGAAGPAIGEHLHGCHECRLQAEGLINTLAVFRQSVRDWSLEPGQPTAVTASNRRFTLRRLVWTAALAAPLIAGLMLPYFRIKSTPKSQAISDADLLVQVDRELSEKVAPSMEPIELRNESK
jgi:hypothetical protein